MLICSYQVDQYPRTLFRDGEPDAYVVFPDEMTALPAATIA